jgi:mannose-6-phosphate isomerase-like protein (cupin superfamily)
MALSPGDDWPGVPHLYRSKRMAGKVVRAGEREWRMHPTFAGVMTKVLIGDDLNGAFSTHLVRLEPAAAIDSHVHQGTVETIFVVYGTGVCIMDGQPQPFIPGSCAFAPADVTHSIRNTGTAPMELLCTFAPPRG